MSNPNSSLNNLFKLFKNRPNYLTRFLLDANAFNDSFLMKIKNNSKLSEDFNESELNNYFNSIEDMKDYYSSFVNELDLNKKRKSKEQILEELTIKIKEAIDNENYEEAARIRDYMIRNNLKKNKN
jgi:excinuclease UvrABC helicase subunit UvrB